MVEGAGSLVDEIRLDGHVASSLEIELEIIYYY